MCCAEPIQAVSKCPALFHSDITSGRVSSTMYGDIQNPTRRYSALGGWQNVERGVKYRNSKVTDEGRDKSMDEVDNRIQVPLPKLSSIFRRLERYRRHKVCRSTLTGGSYLSRFPDHDVVVVTIPDPQDVRGYTVASAGQRELLDGLFQLMPADQIIRQGNQTPFYWLHALSS